MGGTGEEIMSQEDIDALIARMTGGGSGSSESAGTDTEDSVLLDDSVLLEDLENRS